MKGHFFSPKNIEQLVQCIKEKDQQTFFAAGGTDLLVKLNTKKEFGYSLIDLTGVSEMKKIEETSERVIIGASVTMAEIENSQLLKDTIPALTHAAYSLGSTQIRNRATIGGNVANASQSADALPVLFAYEAECEIIDKNGNVRLEPVINVVKGLEKTTLNSDEVITRFLIRKGNCTSAFSKIGARKSVTISKINCCIKLNYDGNIVNEIVCFLGAVGEKPIRATSIEQSLKGKFLSGTTAFDIQDVIRGEIEAAIPTRQSRFYKKEAAISLIDDTLKKLCV